MTEPNGDDVLPPIYREIGAAAQRILDALAVVDADPAKLQDLAWHHRFLHATTDTIYEINRLRRPNWRGETYDR